MGRGGGRSSLILMLLHAVDWRSRRHFAPFSERSRLGWRSHPRIPTRCAHYTPVLGGVKRRKDKGLGKCARKYPGSAVPEPGRAIADSHGPVSGDWLRSGMLFAAKVPVPAVGCPAGPTTGIPARREPAVRHATRPTPGTGTAEQHGGASPLRRCRPKTRESIGESIGMRIRRSGATCKLPENICTPFGQYFRAPRSGFPGRLGFFDFFASGEFQEVGIDFVGQPRISASMAAAQAGAVAAALPGVARGKWGQSEAPG